MASLKQIAAQVGVSYTVVSKVLSGRLGQTRVSEATRESILKAAAEQDYTPNRLAVALKAGRKGAVGVFLHHFGSAGSDVVDRFLRGISSGLEQNDLQMWLRFFNTDEEFLTACDKPLRSQVDGLIVAGPFHPGLVSKLRDLIEHGTMVVSVTNDSSEIAKTLLSNVSVDYEAQGYLACRHLLEQGCRRLACLDTHKDRTVGFLRAHKEMSLPVHRKLVVKADDFSSHSGQTGARRLVESGLLFDGIVCHSDAQAFAAINELTRRGVRVPEDVKITGVDNSPLAEICQIPITSATSEMQQAALVAVESLLKKIRGESVMPVVIEPHLHVRESSVANGYENANGRGRVGKALARG
jgi:LacI family transcriptional regulator